jgi:hypothetical protein
MSTSTSGTEKSDASVIRGEWRFKHKVAALIAAFMALGPFAFLATTSEIHVFQRWATGLMVTPIILAGLWTISAGRLRPKEARPLRPAFSRLRSLVIALVAAALTAAVSYGVMNANRLNIGLARFESGPGALLVVIPMVAYGVMFYHLSTLPDKWNRNKALAWLIVSWVIAMIGPLLWEGFKVAKDYGLVF